MIKYPLTLIAIAFLASPAPSQTAGRATTTANAPRQAELDDEERTTGTAMSWLGEHGWYVRGGVAGWTAQFGDNYGIGFGGDGGYMYGLRENVLLRFSSGYYSFSAQDIENAPPVAESTLGLIPLLAGADYTFGAQNVVPYAGGSAGAIFLRAKFEDPTVTFFKFQDLFDAYFGAQARVGLIYRRSDSSLHFDVMGSYNFVFDELPEFNMGTPATHDYFQISAGITYLLESP